MFGRCGSGCAGGFFGDSSCSDSGDGVGDGDLYTVYSQRWSNIHKADCFSYVPGDTHKEAVEATEAGGPDQDGHDP